MKQNQQQQLILNCKPTATTEQKTVNKLSPQAIRQALTQSAQQKSKKIDKQYRRALSKHASLKSELLD